MLVSDRYFGKPSLSNLIQSKANSNIRKTNMYTATERRKKDVQVSDPTVALERPVLVMEAKETGEGVQGKIHNPNL